MERARSQLLHANLPKLLWGESVVSVNHVNNMSPTSSIDKKNTPFELWYRKKPAYKYLRTSGCVCYTHVHKEDGRKKMDQRSETCIFLGYEESRSCYRALRLRDREVVLSQNVDFHEETFASREASPFQDWFEAAGDFRREEEDENPLVTMQKPFGEGNSESDGENELCRNERRQPTTPPPPTPS